MWQSLYRIMLFESQPPVVKSVFLLLVSRIRIHCRVLRDTPRLCVCAHVVLALFVTTFFRVEPTVHSNVFFVCVRHC